MRYQILNQDADLSLIERLLKVRNISDNIGNFLNPTLANYWLDPFLLNDMDKGVDRIIQALKNKEKIVVF
jgi:single-stranded-DNA-specific exonuclease